MGSDNIIETAEETSDDRESGRELTEMLRKNRTIDWQKKEIVRAQMRKMVKRLLKKYKYPPEDYEFAINTVISQCELWTDNVEPPKVEKIYKYVSETELSKVAEASVPYGEMMECSMDARKDNR